jgi:hypothetical protein
MSVEATMRSPEERADEAIAAWEKTINWDQGDERVLKSAIVSAIREAVEAERAGILNWLAFCVRERPHLKDDIDDIAAAIRARQQGEG